MIAELPAHLRRAVSPYVGIVRTIEECLPAAGDPGLFQAVCEVDGGPEVIGAPLGHLSGIGGTGESRGAAAAAAVGEALERYAATFVPSERLLVGTATELGPRAVAPERFALFSDRQHADPAFPYRRFTSASRIAWAPGRALRDGSEALLPAELVYLGRTRLEGERPITYATSSGLACADTLDDAVARALLEILERDAFMVVWANRLALPLLRADVDDPIDQLERRFFAPTGMRHAAVDLSGFHGVPTVLGIVRAPAGVIGALGVGAGAAPTIEQAWSKALAEAFATRVAGAKLAVLAAGRPPLLASDVATFDDHIRFHADHANSAAASFLDASDFRTPVASIAPLREATAAERISELCDRVEWAGSSAYAVDVTSPDVAQLGLTVVRVIAPELCALDVPQSARFLGGLRLYRAAQAAGLSDAVLDETEVNPDPHPFP